MTDSVQPFLADIWFFLLGFILVLYVVLDGFTLGVGVLSLFAKNEQRRDVMMASLGSVWDANETWLVVFGGALFGAFPQVYGIVLHGLYIPITVMIFALIFRGVAFEFREHGRHKRGWNLAFGLGSTIGAVMQGIALGAVLGGIPVTGLQFSGSVWHWLSPFALLTALGVVFGYTLLGTTYLVLKTEGDLQQRARRFAVIAAWLTVVAGIGISIWTPLRFEYVAERWFSWPNVALLAPLPLAAAACFIMLLRGLRRGFENSPFIWSVGIFVTSFGGLAVSLYPYLVPPTVTALDAASSSKTLVFMLTGIGILIPIMMVYNGYQYLVFRGKARVDEAGYH
jgi:cytochrome d ubiquinol oxidase subunit II